MLQPLTASEWLKAVEALAKPNAEALLAGLIVAKGSNSTTSAEQQLGEALLEYSKKASDDDAASDEGNDDSSSEEEGEDLDLEMKDLFIMEELLDDMIAKKAREMGVSVETIEERFAECPAAYEAMLQHVEDTWSPANEKAFKAWCKEGGGQDDDFDHEDYFEEEASDADEESGSLWDKEDDESDDEELPSSGTEGGGDAEKFKKMTNDEFEAWMQERLNAEDSDGEWEVGMSRDPDDDADSSSDVEEMPPQSEKEDKKGKGRKKKGGRTNQSRAHRGPDVLRGGALLARAKAGSVRGCTTWSSSHLELSMQRGCAGQLRRGQVLAKAAKNTQKAYLAEEDEASFEAHLAKLLEEEEGSDWEKSIEGDMDEEAGEELEEESDDDFDEDFDEEFDEEFDEGELLSSDEDVDENTDEEGAEGLTGEHPEGGSDTKSFHQEANAAECAVVDALIKKTLKFHPARIGIVITALGAVPPAEAKTKCDELAAGVCKILEHLQELDNPSEAVLMLSWLGKPFCVPPLDDVPEQDAMADALAAAVRKQSSDAITAVVDAALAEDLAPNESFIQLARISTVLGAFGIPHKAFWQAVERLGASEDSDWGWLASQAALAAWRMHKATEGDWKPSRAAWDAICAALQDSMSIRRNQAVEALLAFGALQAALPEGCQSIPYKTLLSCLKPYGFIAPHHALAALNALADLDPPNMPAHKLHHFVEAVHSGFPKSFDDPVRSAAHLYVSLSRLGIPPEDSVRSCFDGCLKEKASELEADNAAVVLSALTSFPLSRLDGEYGPAFAPLLKQVDACAHDLSPDYVSLAVLAATRTATPLPPGLEAAFVEKVPTVDLAEVMLILRCLSGPPVQQSEAVYRALRSAVANAAPNIGAHDAIEVLLGLAALHLAPKGDTLAECVPSITSYSADYSLCDAIEALEALAAHLVGITVEDAAKNINEVIMAHRHDLSPSEAFRIIVAAAVLVTCARDTAIPRLGFNALLAVGPSHFWPDGEEQLAGDGKQAASASNLLQLPQQELAKVCYPYSHNADCCICLSWCTACQHSRTTPNWKNL
jgi:hypothetical protein